MHKYDIGLVSCWTWENYGTNITYYALYKVLKDMGYAIKMLDRPLNAPAYPPELSDTNNVKAGLFSNCPYQPSELQAPLGTRGELRSVADECDTIMIGSDQFFNNSVNNDFGKIFYLDWVPDNVRKIAYAASWGRDEAWGGETATRLMAYYLSKYDAFSVREKSTVAFIKEMFNREAAFVLDPIFLCDKSNYENLAKNFEQDLQNDSYIFCYVLDPSQEKAELLKKISRRLEKKLRVISDPHYTEDFVKAAWDIPTEMNVCEERWIALIKNSDFVITDSFHGTCLSLIFEKNFISISNPLRGSTRFDCLKDLFEIQDKIVPKIEDVDLDRQSLFTMPDYKKILDVIKTESSRSKKWLSDALKIPVGKKEFSSLDALKLNIESVETENYKKEKEISQRIFNVETHGANVDKRFDSAEQRIFNVETHGANLESKLESLERRISRLEKLTGIAFLRRLKRLLKK